MDSLRVYEGVWIRATRKQIWNYFRVLMRLRWRGVVNARIPF
jgi:hypothetical protein